MTPEHKEAGEIARGLTKAQRRTVLRGYWPDSKRGFWPLRNSLADKGLVPLNNDLCAAVRAILTPSTPDATHRGNCHCPACMTKFEEWSSGRVE